VVEVLLDEREDDAMRDVAIDELTGIDLLEVEVDGEESTDRVDVELFPNDDDTFEGSLGVVAATAEEELRDTEDVGTVPVEADEIGAGRKISS